VVAAPGCGEFPAQQLVYLGITDEMTEYTVASRARVRRRPAAGQAQGSRRHRGRMTDVIAMSVRHSLLRAHLRD